MNSGKIKLKFDFEKELVGDILNLEKTIFNLINEFNTKWYNKRLQIYNNDTTIIAQNNKKKDDKNNKQTTSEIINNNLKIFMENTKSDTGIISEEIEYLLSYYQAEYRNKESFINILEEEVLSEEDNIINKNNDLIKNWDDLNKENISFNKLYETLNEFKSKYHIEMNKTENCYLEMEKSRGRKGSINKLQSTEKSELTMINYLKKLYKEYILAINERNNKIKLLINTCTDLLESYSNDRRNLFLKLLDSYNILNENNKSNINETIKYFQESNKKINEVKDVKSVNKDEFKFEEYTPSFIDGNTGEIKIENEMTLNVLLNLIKNTNLKLGKEIDMEAIKNNIKLNILIDKLKTSTNKDPEVLSESELTLLKNLICQRNYRKTFLNKLNNERGKKIFNYANKFPIICDLFNHLFDIFNYYDENEHIDIKTAILLCQSFFYEDSKTKKKIFIEQKLEFKNLILSQEDFWTGFISQEIDGEPNKKEGDNDQMIYIKIYSNLINILTFIKDKKKVENIIKILKDKYNMKDNLYQTLLDSLNSEYNNATKK